MKHNRHGLDPTSPLVQPLYYRIQAEKATRDTASITASYSEPRYSADSKLPSLEGQIEGRPDNSSDGNEQPPTESHSDASSQTPDEGAASISFGALAKAQESLGKRKQSVDRGSDNDARESHQYRTFQHYANDEALERKAGKQDTRDFSRTSKHAPAELSSKKAVSRKREVVPIRKDNHRDPRFEPLGGGPLDEQKIKKNYAFLDSYRDSEISELKSAIRKTKDQEVREKLKRALLSMESRKRDEETKKHHQEVLRKHRREEKEKIEKGKKPFYLKKANQKKMVLVERFQGMKEKQIDNIIERRRKKKAAKERRWMPEQRRG